jgi:predicted PurR-regulated permease PerM
MSSSGTRRRIPTWLDTGAALAWRVLVVAAALFLAVFVLGRLDVVVVPVIGGLWVCAVLVPPARWLHRHGWPSLAATWTVFLIGLASVVGLGLWLVPLVGAQFGPLGRTLAHSADSLRHWLAHGPLHLSQAQIDRYTNDIRGRLTGGGTAGAIAGGRILQGAASGLRLLVHGVASVILTVVVSFFFVKDGRVMSDWFLAQFQPSTAARLRAIGARAWATLSGYVRGTAINGFVNALLMSVGLVLLAVPLVPAIAVLTFAGGLFPIVGAFASGVVAALVALAAKGPGTAGLVVVLTVAIHHVEGYLVGPVVLGRAVRLHTLVVLLALTAGGTVAGVLGAFIAVPLTAVTVAVIGELRRTAEPPEPSENRRQSQKLTQPAQ